MSQIINMAGISILSVVKGGINILRKRDAGTDIEKNLNEEFVGIETTFENYKENEVTLEVDSIVVRPRYSSKKISQGIEKLDSKYFFTNLEGERSSPSLIERIRALAIDEWITVMKLSISTGDLNDIRPPGLNLRGISGRESLFGHRNVEKPTSIEQEILPNIVGIKRKGARSDSIKIKVPYNGSLGEYRQSVSNSLDFLEGIQDDMESYVISQMMFLYQNKNTIEPGNDRLTEERIEKLGKFVVGDKVDIEILGESLKEFQEYISEMEYEE